MIQEKQLDNSPISRPTHTTLTDQTVLAIQEAIKRGKFPPGSQLPPEMELLQMMGISRTTLREALRVLETQPERAISKSQRRKLPNLSQKNSTSRMNR